MNKELDDTLVIHFDNTRMLESFKRFIKEHEPELVKHFDDDIGIFPSIFAMESINAVLIEDDSHKGS